jgi:hypothetical protein
MTIYRRLADPDGLGYFLDGQFLYTLVGYQVENRSNNFLLPFTGLHVVHPPRLAYLPVHLAYLPDSQRFFQPDC